MSEMIAYYHSTDATAASRICELMATVEMQRLHICDLDHRLAVQIRLRSEAVDLIVKANERIAELEAELARYELPAVPYALEPKQERRCDTCRYFETYDQCRSCGPRRENHKVVSYAIPRYGCECGACRAARERGEVER